MSRMFFHRYVLIVDEYTAKHSNVYLYVLDFFRSPRISAHPIVAIRDIAVGYGYGLPCYIRDYSF